MAKTKSTTKKTERKTERNARTDEDAVEVGHTQTAAEAMEINRLRNERYADKGKKVAK